MKLLSITFITAATIAGSAIAAPVREHRPPDVESALQLRREAREHQLEQAEQHYHEIHQTKRAKRAKPKQAPSKEVPLTSAKQAPSKEVPLPPPPKQAKPKQTQPEHDWKGQLASFQVAKQAPSKGVPLSGVLVPPKARKPSK